MPASARLRPPASGRPSRLARGREHLGDEQRFGLCLAGLVVAVGAFLALPLAPRFLEILRLPTLRDWVVQGKPQGVVAGFWITGAVSFFAAVWQWRSGRRPSWRLLLWGVVVLHLLALVVPPVVSDDVYAYNFYGVVQAHYHENPYLLTPAQHSLDPLFTFWSWRFTGAVYGPPFLWLLRAVAGVTGPSMITWVVIMKLLLTAAEIGAIVLLCRAVAPSSDRRWPLLVLGWNPMVLQSVPMSAHVDAILLLAMAAALLGHRRGRHGLAFAALVLAFLVKLYLGPLVALYGLWLALRAPSGRRLLTLAGLGTVTVAVTVAVYLPYVLEGGSRVFSSVLYVGGNFTSGSGPNVVRTLISWLLQLAGVDRAGAARIGTTVARDLGLLVIAAGFAVVARRLRHDRDPMPLLATWFLVYLFATPWVFFWHVVPLLAFTAALPWGTVSLVTLVLAMGLTPLTAGVRGVPPPEPTTARELLTNVIGFAMRYCPALVALMLARRAGRVARAIGNAPASAVPAGSPVKPDGSSSGDRERVR